MSETKSYSQMRKEFYDSFETKIVPMLRPYEAERKMMKLLDTVIVLIFGVMVIMVILSFLLSYNIILEWKFQLILMLAALAWSGRHGLKKSFENKVKKKIMPIVCACLGRLKWSEDSYMFDHILQESYIIPAYDKATCDDIFRGVYKDVYFEIIEGTFSKRKEKNHYIVFKGVIVKLNMNKNKHFNSHTIIKPDSIIHISPAMNLEHTTLEDVQFEKKYDVFTNDPVDARYLITPSFMVRLNNMKTAFCVNNVSCAFYHDNLMIALPTPKDLFSICSLEKPVDDPKQYYTMYEEIVSIIKLIDYFKLDQKIGM